MKQRSSTPLHEAARLGSDAICKLILRGGANVNAHDSLEGTPLHHAVKHEQLVVVRSLLSARADLEARDIFQRTALHHAVRRNSVPLMKILLDHGANPDVVNRYGLSPRQVVRRAGVPRIVAMFYRVPQGGRKDLAGGGG